MNVEILLTLCSGAVLLHLIIAHVRLRRAVAHPPPAPPALRSYPSLTMIRPVKGLDVGARENLAAALEHGYPGEVETLFVFDDESDPALPVVRQAIAEHQGDRRRPAARVLFSGPPPEGRTGKLNAMIVGMAAARGQVIGFCDSDTRPDRDMLRVLVDLLLTQPCAGAAFAPVVVMTPTPRTLGDVGCALLLNALYGPRVAMLSARRGDLPFIMGEIMLFRREALAAIGGLECATGQLVDDMYLGQRLARAGWRNLQSTHPLPIMQQGTDALGFLKNFRRWVMFSRSGLRIAALKVPEYLRGVEFWFGLIAAAWLLQAQPDAPQWALLPLLIPLAINASLVDLHHAHGGSRLRGIERLMPLCIYLLAPPVVLSLFVWREVAWRGRTYGLDGAARLATEGAQAG